MSTKPTVSIIVPTYFSVATLDDCLKSIRDQSYPHIELIVVDNNSTDDTKKIAKKYTKQVFNKGPERSAQRNYGVSIASGKYVVIIDSDMVLTPDVIKSCVDIAEKNKGIGGIIIPEESFGEGFWAKCKQLERSFYVGVSWMEAARFFKRDLYLELGGYNEELVSGEDWDLSQRAAKVTTIGRIDDYILHNEGNLKLVRTLKKKFYYAQKIGSYTTTNNDVDKDVLAKQTSPFSRYALYFSKPRHLFKNPLIGVGMLFMKSAELGIGALGIVKARVQKG